MYIFSLRNTVQSFSISNTTHYKMDGTSHNIYCEVVCLFPSYVTSDFDEGING